jgi:hypothetical protein
MNKQKHISKHRNTRHTNSAEALLGIPVRRALPYRSRSYPTPTPTPTPSSASLPGELRDGSDFSVTPGSKYGTVKLQLRSVLHL